MRRRFTQAVLWIAAALCICALPLAANGASWGGTVLSKGLVYDDVYGVVNGNALMSKVVNKSGDLKLIELDLVRSDGTILFKTGYTELDGTRTASKDYSYMPTFNFMNPEGSYDSDFTQWMGGMMVKDALTGKLGFVNNNGSIIIKNQDDIIAVESERLLSGVLVDSHIELALFDLNGKVLDTKTVAKGASQFYGFQKSSDAIELRMSHSSISCSVAISGDQIAVHEQTIEPPEFDDSTIVDTMGYKVTTTSDGGLLFSKPNGTKTKINGPLRYAHKAWKNDGTDIGITAEEPSGVDRFFTIDGTELFKSKGYSNVNKLENSNSYLCNKPYLEDGDPIYKSRFILELPNGTSIELEASSYNDANRFSVCGSYILASGPLTEEGGISGRRLSSIIDANGSIALSIDPEGSWSFVKAPYEWSDDTNQSSYIFSKARYVLAKRTGSTSWGTNKYLKRYLDDRLQLVAEFDGYVNSLAPLTISENTVYPLFLNSEHAWTPSALYDRDLEPVTYHGMQRVMANGAAKRGNLAYVTDGKGSYGALDAAGNPVIPIEFEAICDVGEAQDDSTILVKRDGKWYFMDVTGRAPQPQAPEFSDVVAGETPHAEHIAWLATSGVSKGWENGDGSYSFRPYTEVARCDMAAFLYRLAGSPVFKPTVEQRAAFSDVDEGTPHAREVWWLAAQGISAGWDEADGTKTFRPYETVKRCDMAAFLNRLARNAGKPAGAGSPFADVVDATPHRASILWLASNEVSKGWTEPDGAMTFRPYETVKRADMAAFLHRMDEKGLVGETR